MVGSTAFIKALPMLAVSAFAGVNYPTIPADLTTPFQQRLAVYGPNCKIYILSMNIYGGAIKLTGPSQPSLLVGTPMSSSARAAWSTVPLPIA